MDSRTATGAADVRGWRPVGPGGYRRAVDSPSLDLVALRRGVLATSVLDDIPLEPTADGVLVGDSWDDRSTWTPVGWRTLGQALVGAAPQSLPGRLRLRDWLRTRALARRHGAALSARVVALALPVDHVLHPGPRWVEESPLGGVLDVGLGLRAEVTGLAVPLPPSALRVSDLDDDGWWEQAWQQARAHLDSMAELAVDRLVHDGKGVLAPIGGVDVLTLLASPRLREHLANGDGIGMRALAAPMRSRAWFDLARIDPAFVGAAAIATDPEQRGLSRPLLVTVDEVTMVPQRGHTVDLARMALADPAASTALIDRDVLYR